MNDDLEKLKNSNEITSNTLISNNTNSGLDNSSSKNGNKQHDFMSVFLLLIKFGIFMVFLYAFFSVIDEAYTSDETKAKRKLTRDAIQYFAKKYNINEKSIEITSNDLHTKDKKCFLACAENLLHITYKNENYIIEYYPDKEIYVDNFQYNEIYKDFSDYLNSRTSFATERNIKFLESDVRSTSQKYDGDLKKYFAKVRENYEPSEDGVKSLFTDVDILLYAQTAEEAKGLMEKYSVEINNIIKELDDFGVCYRIIIAEKLTYNGSMTFYFYEMSSFDYSFYDNVDNKKNSCARSQYKDGVCIGSEVK